MANTFEVVERKDGRFGWHLQAGNGEIIATDGGQGYESRSNCAAIGAAIVQGLYSPEAIDLVDAEVESIGALDFGVIHGQVSLTLHEPGISVGTLVPFEVPIPVIAKQSYTEPDVVARALTPAMVVTVGMPAIRKAAEDLFSELPSAVVTGA